MFELLSNSHISTYHLSVAVAVVLRAAAVEE
jgi:hypothetical protein